MNLDGLLYYQKPHTVKLADSLAKNHIAIDGSDTGTGKTYVASAIVREWDPATVVVCPKIAIDGWERKSAEMGASLTAVNYEMVRTGRTSLGEWRRHNGYDYFYWAPGVEFLIFDEGHRCQGDQTQNANLLLGAGLSQKKVLYLSATIANSPLQLRALGALLRWHDWSDWGSWLIQNGCVKNFWGTWSFHANGSQKEAERIMKGLNEKLWQRGSRMLIKDIPDFPKNKIIPELYQMGDAQTIENIRNLMAEALKELEERKAGDRDPELPLTKLLRARQELEILKTPIAVELAHDELAQGRSVVIFSNFRKTVDSLAEMLQNYHPSIVVGGQKAEERAREIGIFQSNQTHVLLVQIDSGSESMDAHDLYGRPRTSITFPGLSVNRLQQAWGRINRAGARSTAIQRVILLKGLDEKLFYKLADKHFNMNTLLVSDMVDVERLGIKVTKDYELRNQNAVAAFRG